MYVSARERRLIEMLLETSQDLTIKDMAESLDVSARTIHRDLKGVEDVLESHGLSLEKKTGKGIAIFGEEERRRDLKMSINEQNSVDYTPEERHVLILSWLLESQDPVKLMTLSNELGVTVATISHDLDKIEEILVKFQLQLIRKRGYGVEVQGEEGNIREAIQYIIMQHMNEHDFLKMLRENIQSPAAPSLDAVSDHLLGLVDRQNISTIEQTVNSIRAELPYHLADSAYIGLVIHLALAIERLQQGEFIQMEDEYLARLQSTKEFDIAGKLISKLEEIFELSIPKAETGYITMHLMGAKVRYNQDYILEDSSLSVAFKAKQLIEFVSNTLQQNLHQSDQLLNDLVVHLKPSLYRIHQGMDIKNPLREQIEQDYPELFLTLERATEFVFPKISFPKEETAFLVMHFASALLNMEGSRGFKALVVCSSGIGTAKILAAKLKKQFLEIEEVDHQSLFDLDEIAKEDYDLVVSTIPLDNIEDYVLVNPMLPNSDTQRLEHRIRKLKIMDSMKPFKENVPEEDETLQTIQDSVGGIQRYAATVGQLLNGLGVFSYSGLSKKEILYDACLTLQNKNMLTEAESITEALVNRETVGGLGIPGTTLTLYHTRKPAIYEPSFTIIKLSEAVQVVGMDGEMMSSSVLILMLAPQDMSKEGLEVISFLSSLLIEEPEIIRVFEKEEEEEIKNYVSNQLHQFFKKKIS
ncbi:BglG family transcription antiterminator [Halobacillus halophilus]|uniref:BglG family transcription antiterminator n=1 Tax=Halobacillus halophilus TaxID=1570 RepID=UPI001CD379C6|nr:PRD domain-containing protein [Halobacillus halophilus]MCA1010174.1 BglG family transcription antiterminator [Halobacillus halophilus]